MAEPAGAAERPAPAVPTADRRRDATLEALLADLRALAVGTARVWWRLLPQLLSLYLLGWLGSQLALRLAVLAGDLSPWLALVLFALNFVSLLVALVLILRLVGLELGIWSMIPAEESVGDGRDQSVSQLLAVTLLPFVGLYAAFGQVNQAAEQLTTEQFVRYGIGDTPSVLGVLQDASTQHPWRLLAGLAGIYVLRRAVDLLHQRTGVRPLGLVVAFIESVFILVVVLGGIRLLQLALIWLRDRAVVGWLGDVGDALTALLARLHLHLPDLLAAVWGFLSAQVWPVLTEVVSQPVIWLAVAALVYGSQVLSLADVWRRGQTLAGRVPGAGTFARHRDKRAVRRLGPPPQGLRRVVEEAREAFFGDIDDKYLPTFHSLRLVLRAGVVFLGAFVLVYAVVAALTSYGEQLLHRLTGGHTVDFWLVWGPWLDLAQTLPFEPLRLCLLAVAFRRCLELFQQRTVVPVPAGAPVPGPAPAAVAAG